MSEQEFQAWKIKKTINEIDIETNLVRKHNKLNELVWMTGKYITISPEDKKHRLEMILYENGNGYSVKITINNPNAYPETTKVYDMDVVVDCDFSIIPTSEIIPNREVVYSYVDSITTRKFRFSNNDTVKEIASAKYIYKPNEDDFFFVLDDADRSYSNRNAYQRERGSMFFSGMLLEIIDKNHLKFGTFLLGERNNMIFSDAVLTRIKN